MAFLYLSSQIKNIEANIYNKKLECLDTITSQLDNFNIGRSVYHELTHDSLIEGESKVSLAKLVSYDKGDENIKEKLESIQLNLDPGNPLGEDGYIITSGYFAVRHTGGPGSTKTRLHNALDMVAKKGKVKHELYHIGCGGNVTRAGYNRNLWQYGNLVEVLTDDGYYMRFGHLSKISVKVGERVEVGELIGFMGNTGRCSISEKTGKKAIHLHLETFYRGKSGEKILFNPIKFLRKGHFGKAKNGINKVKQFITQSFPSPPSQEKSSYDADFIMFREIEYD
ncbi:MAG: M23 family metallopeptidase [Candidatus Pacearchaeota archaeon]|nr:MAG: M23 family metallopeptidase [Candidatus Pacearchaeota archaeon]